MPAYRRDPERMRLLGSSRWKKLRNAVVAERKWCEVCAEEGRTTVGVEVHHDDPALDRFFDETNLRLLCFSDHQLLHRGGASRKASPQNLSKRNDDWDRAVADLLPDLKGTLPR